MDFKLPEKNADTVPYPQGKAKSFRPAGAGKIKVFFNLKFMRKTTPFLVLLLLCVSLVSGQSNKGTLKIFSDEPIIVYVDQVQTSDYSEISLVAGTHYVKAINKDEVKIYSEIVTVVANQVTSVFIESPAPQQAVTQPQPVIPAEPAPVAENPKPANDIYIGQIEGVLPQDMDGAFGIKFGEDAAGVHQIMEQAAAQSKKSGKFYDYAISTTQGYCMVETRFIDSKLFDIVVGYTTLYEENSKVKLNKNELPFDAFNKMYSTLVAHYGEPATVTRKFTDGYAENDGKLLEALKNKKAIILYRWVHPETGNFILLTLAYSTAPIAAMTYTSGSLEKEAKSRGLVINNYNYGKTFEENQTKK
jgi:hypothetical protein